MDSRLGDGFKEGAFEEDRNAMFEQIDGPDDRDRVCEWIDKIQLGIAFVSGFLVALIGVMAGAAFS